MADSAAATQAAFIAKYRGNTTLQGLLAAANSAITGPEWNIFDQGGSGQITPMFPYIYVHPVTMNLGTALAMGKDAQDILMQVDVFTSEEGFELALSLMAQCYALTHGPVAGMFALGSGFSNVLSLFQRRVLLEETTDKLVQHVMDQYKLENQG